MPSEKMHRQKAMVGGADRLVTEDQGEEVMMGERQS